MEEKDSERDRRGGKGKSKRMRCGRKGRKKDGEGRGSSKVPAGPVELFGGTMETKEMDDSLPRFAV